MAYYICLWFIESLSVYKVFTVVLLGWALSVSWSLWMKLVRLRLLGLVLVVGSVQLAEVEKHVLYTTIRLNITGKIYFFNPNDTGVEGALIGQLGR